MDAHLTLQAEPRPPYPHPAAEAQGHQLGSLDAALRQRGSLTIWFTAEAIAGWRAAPRTTPGGQPWHSPLAILTALTLRAVFRLALRQTEGLIGSIIGLLGLALAVPDHSTLSRRAKTLAVPRPQLRRNGEPMHLLVDSTGLRLCGAGGAGQGSNGVASGRPAEGSGFGKSTAPRRAGPGGSCTSAWMPATARSSPRRSRPRRSTTAPRLAPCSIGSQARSPRSPAMVGMTKTAFTPVLPTTPPKQSSSSHRARLPCRARRPRRPLRCHSNRFAAGTLGSSAHAA